MDVRTNNKPSAGGGNLAVELVTAATGVVVKLRGEVGLDEVDYLKAQMMLVRRSKPKLVVFDLTDLRYISSPGMGAFASFRRNIVSDGGKAALAAIPPTLEGAIKVACLNQLFAIHPTVEKALGK